MIIFVYFALSTQGDSEKTSTTDPGALSIANSLLYQSYFVCLYEKDVSVLIEYGKVLATADSSQVFLIYTDKEDVLNPRFYAFGNMNEEVQIWDAHIVRRDFIDAECKGDTYKDLKENLCVQKCHEYCDPFAGYKCKLGFYYYIKILVFYISQQPGAHHMQNQNGNGQFTFRFSCN